MYGARVTIVRAYSGFSRSPAVPVRGWDGKGEFFYSMEILYGGIPGRPIGDGMDGHSWWPLFENIPTEYLEAYYPLRIDGYTTVTDSGGLATTVGADPRDAREQPVLGLPGALRGRAAGVAPPADVHALEDVIARVSVLAEQGEWVEVRIGDRSGWARREHVGPCRSRR